MAINKVAKGSRLTLTVQTGVTASNKPAYHQRVYKNVKASSNDSDIYAIGDALAKLQKYPLTSISRLDDSSLANG